MRRGTTLNDLMQWNNSIFDDILLPECINKDVLISRIMFDNGLLKPVYQNWDVFKVEVKYWFHANYWNFERLCKVQNIEYNPLHNYDRHEELEGTTDLEIQSTNVSQLTRNDTGTIDTDTTTLSGDNTQFSGQDTKTKGNIKLETGNETTDKDFDKMGTESYTRNSTGSDNETEVKQETDYVQPYNLNAGLQAVQNGWYPTDRRDLNNHITNKTNSNIESGETVYNIHEDTTEIVTKDLTTTDSGNEQVEYGQEIKEDGSIVEDKTQTNNLQRTENESGTGSETRTGKTGGNNYIYGNVGVTTSQKMFNEELDLLERYNIYKFISNRFTYDLMVGVY